MSRNKAFPPDNGDIWESVWNMLTPEEQAASNVKIALLREIINARLETGMTQKQLEEMSGVKQPVIARLEKGTTDPRLSTMIKILTPLGKTLAVVPVENGRAE